jgi:hypothetical protein
MRHPPVLVPVQVASIPAMHSVAPLSHSSVHDGEPQTPFMQLCPVGQAVAGDHVSHGVSP